MGNMITLADWMFYGLGILIIILGFTTFALASAIYSNQMIRTFMQAKRSGGRLVMVHYPSGQGEFIIPKKEETEGASAPYWNVGGTVRFKDITGEKWEEVEGVKVLHYTHRSPTPIGTEQAIAIDQLNEMFAHAGMSTRGYIGDAFYMIAQAAKGKAVESEAWKRISALDRETQNKIKEILDYIKTHPEVRYMLSKSGAFTYQTSVSVIDHVNSYNVSSTSDTISFVRDQERRRRNDSLSNITKWAPYVALIFVTAVGGVIFMVGTGMVPTGTPVV